MDPRRPHLGTRLAITLLILATSCGILYAVEDAVIPAHQSHTVGWQEVIVFVQAKDGYAHGQEIPATVMDDRRAAASILNEYYKRFSYGRTGLRFTIFPYFVENTSGEWAIVKDAKTIDPNLSISGYHRIWNDSWQGGAGRAFVGGTMLRTGLGDHYPARHELAHTYGVSHPDNVSIGDSEGANTKIRWGWIRTNDPNGFAYTRVTAPGTYRIYDYGDPDHEPMGQPGGSIALVIDTADGPLAINNRGGNEWSIFLRDDRLDLNGSADKVGRLGLSASHDVSSYRFTDSKGWRVDITLQQVIPKDASTPLAADIAIAFPDGPKPSIDIVKPSTLSTTILAGEGLEIVANQTGMDEVRFTATDTYGNVIHFGTVTGSPASAIFKTTTVASYTVRATGYVNKGGSMVESESDKTYVKVNANPDLDPIIRQVTLQLAPNPAGLVPIHLTSPVVTGSPADGGHRFPGLDGTRNQHFGFALSGDG